MTQRHSDWITWSPRYLEEHVELQTRAAQVGTDQISNLYRVNLLK
jgi:hypothetical protein